MAWRICSSRIADRCPWNARYENLMPRRISSTDATASKNSIAACMPIINYFSELIISIMPLLIHTVGLLPKSFTAFSQDISKGRNGYISSHINKQCHISTASRWQSMPIYTLRGKYGRFQGHSSVQFHSPPAFIAIVESMRASAFLFKICGRRLFKMSVVANAKPASHAHTTISIWLIIIAWFGGGFRFMKCDIIAFISPPRCTVILGHGAIYFTSRERVATMIYRRAFLNNGFK